MGRDGERYSHLVSDTELHTDFQTGKFGGKRINIEKDLRLPFLPEKKKKISNKKHGHQHNTDDNIPESCNCENPLIKLKSCTNPPAFSPRATESATGFAMPYGTVAPANTWPPAAVPINGSTYRNTSSPTSSPPPPPPPPNKTAGSTASSSDTSGRDTRGSDGASTRTTSTTNTHSTTRRAARRPRGARARARVHSRRQTGPPPGRRGWYRADAARLSLR